MKADKCVFTVRKFNPGDSSVVRLDDESMALIRELQAASGLPAKHLVCKMIQFAAPYVEFREG